MRHRETSLWLLLILAGLVGVNWWAWKVYKDRDRSTLSQRPAEFVLLFQSGQDALREGRWTEAVDAFRRALQLVPEDPEAQAGMKNASEAACKGVMALGREALKQERWADAQHAFAEALRYRPDDSDAQSGRQQAQNGLNYEEAMVRGRRALKDKRWADAQKAFAEALQYRPDDAEAIAGKFVAEGRRAFEQQSYAEAERLATKALALVQDYPDALALLTQLKQIPPEVIPPPRPDMVPPKGSIVDVLTRGQNALEKEDFAEARKCFEAARTLDPNNKVVTEWLVKVEFATLVHSGRVAIKLGQYRQAIDYLEQALKLRSDDKAVVILLQKAKEEELRVAYKAAMQRGRDYWAGKRLPEAKKAFGDALVLKPGDVEAQRFLEQVEKAFADPNGKKPSSPKGGDALVAVLAADSSRLDNEDFVKQLELLQAEQGKRLVHGGPCLLTKKGLVPWQRSVKPPSEDLFRSAEYEKLFAKAFEEVKNLEAQVENKTFRTVFIWETNYNPKFGNKDVKVPQERRMRLCYWLYQSSEESERLEGWFGGRQYARRVPKVSQLKEWVEALLRK